MTQSGHSFGDTAANPRLGIQITEFSSPNGVVPELPLIDPAPAKTAFDPKASSDSTRYRRYPSTGALSLRPVAMIFKLAEAAGKSWRRLDDHNQLPKIILGVRFTGGIEVVKPKAQAAAAWPLPSPRFSDSSKHFESDTNDAPANWAFFTT